MTFYFYLQVNTLNACIHAQNHHLVQEQLPVWVTLKDVIIHDNSQEGCMQYMNIYARLFAWEHATETTHTVR